VGGQVLDSGGTGQLSSADFCTAIKKLVGLQPSPLHSKSKLR
jgi:hypothetical protein